MKSEKISNCLVVIARFGKIISLVLMCLTLSGLGVLYTMKWLKKYSFTSKAKPIIEIPLAEFNESKSYVYPNRPTPGVKVTPLSQKPSLVYVVNSSQ
jgi:hypothetical protein